MSGQLNPRQIALLRDFRMHGFMAFFDSPFRLEGPGLRELGMFEGIGDNTRISAAGMDAIKADDSTLRAAISSATGGEASR